MGRVRKVMMMKKFLGCERVITALSGEKRMEKNWKTRKKEVNS